MTSLKSIPMIEEEDVEKYLEFSALFSGLEEAFVNFSKGSEGGIIQPVRSSLKIENQGGFGMMPAYSRTDGALATKIVSYFPKNHEKGLPTHLAQVLLYDSETGVLKAVIDGTSVTTIRTAVASAVATKHLANPKSKILAILGAGVQGKSHWKALTQLYKFDEVRIWSKTKSNSENFASVTGAKVCETVEDAANNADIICTCTGSSEPVLFAKHVKDGAHINGVGACEPTWQEMEPELMRKSIVVADSREACMKESGDLILSKAEIYAELGEIIAKKKPAPVERITIFDSMGMAIEDVVSARIVYEKYLADKK